MRPQFVPNVVGGLVLAASLFSARAATAPAAPTGFISAKGFLNIGSGTAVTDLTNNPKFPNSPDVAYYYPYFEWNADPSGDINTPANNAYGDAYGAQMNGYFYPPVTGDYVFFLSSDDGGNLYLSTDTDPANKKLIAQEAGWSNPRNWDTIGGGSTVEAKNSSTFPGTQWGTKDAANGGAKITLQAKQPYYIEALFKEGGGGDNLAVAVQAPDGSIDATLPIPGKYLAPFTQSTAASILSQPKDVAGYAGGTAKLSVGLDLPPGVTISSVKWQKNGTDISGATDTTLSLPLTAADNGAKVKAIVTTSAGTLTSNDANISVATIANEFAPGVVKFDAYTEISGTSISNLTDSDKYTAGTPDDIQLLTGINTPNSYGDNYGAKVTGFIIPQDSGDFTFFLRSDDASQLWLSTDENPANAVLIAEETGCCQAFLEPDSTVGGWHDNGSGMGQTTLTPIKLTAGKKYAFYALLKEGGGGDYLQVALRKAGDKTSAAALAPIGGAWIGANAKPNLGDPQITKQPVLPPTMIQGQPWSLSVDGIVTPTGFNYPIIVQWQKNGADIPGATSKTYTISSVAPSDAGTYRAVVSAPSGKSTNSTEVTAKVDADTTPPTLASAQRSFKTDTKVLVIFSEPVSAATAGTAANYKINNGITVSAATVSTNNPRQVELTTSSIAKGTTNQLSVSGVQDRFGNTIAANSSINIGLQKSIFFVTADPGPLTFPGDNAVQQHLLDRGFDVTLAMGSDVPDDGSTALGSDLIIESSSLGSGTVETADGIGKFRTLAIPALEWEASSTDAFGFQQANPTTGTTDNQTQINIVDPSSPLAAGFPAGPVTVTSAAATYSQSTPTGAHIVATLAGSPDQDVLYSYEKGDKGYNDFVMPARRVFFFFQDNTASVANDNGWKLFDAAVDWLLGIQSSPPSQGGGGTGGTLAISRSANNLTITWSGSGTLQSATGLTAPISWKDETSTSPFQTTTTGTAKFFRLKQ